MDELILFYYYCWLLCLLIYFFMPKSTVRMVSFIWILVFILTSQFYVPFASIQVSLSFIVLLIGTLILVGLSIYRLYEFIVSFICMISSAGLLMWEKTAPVLFFMPSKIIVPFLIVMIILFLVKTLSQRVIIAVVGLTLGQLLYEMILIIYYLHYTIGDYVYVTYILMTVLLLVVVECLKRCVKIMFHYTKALLH